MVIVASYSLWGITAGFPAELQSGASLRHWFNQLGAWGPAAVVGSMVVAILFSPIPSAPIALAAGAIYGHFWGAIYVILGSEIGAVAAFGIARFLGRDFLQNRIGDSLNRGLAGSQNFMTWTVFISRLLPFISFDIVSYAAGLTSLTFVRFAAATLAGVIPVSVLLAHFGSEFVASEASSILLSIALLGLLTGIPFFVKFISRYYQK